MYIRIKSENRYDAVGAIVQEWCEKNYYTDFLVTLNLDGEESTELLLFDSPTVSFYWLSDWDEGQKNVFLEGFLPVESVIIRTFPEGPDEVFVDDIATDEEGE